MKNEYKLILNAVLRNRTAEEESQIDELLAQSIDWELVGGQLVNHRLGGYFYTGLNEKQKKKLPKEMERILNLIVLAQKKQTLEIIEVLKPVIEDFDKEGIRYAGLKGAVFNAGLYNPGDRRSNDSDLLVYEEDLDKIDTILRAHGYIQTYGEGGKLVEASRKEKLIQRMNYHDLVPYMKAVDNEFSDFHEIDINFHFDSKTNDITKLAFDRGTVFYQNECYRIKGLPWDMNLAHLCIHFYREATNSLWINDGRDLTLYKIVDVMNSLRACKDENMLKAWPELMRSLNLQQQGYFTMYALTQFFDDKNAKNLMEALKPDNDNFLFEIKIEGQNRTETRTRSIADAAFDLKL